MLEKITIAVLLCVIGILIVFIQVERQKLRDMRKERDSWKLAAEHWEKQAHGW